MVVLAGMGLDPVGCVVAAALGNTLGGMTCYWIGTLGKTEWITRLGVSTRQLARARKFLSGRGALMAFFAFLPTIGEAIAIVLGCGPACADTDTLRALLRAGMRGVRLNLSHGPLAERAPWLESLRRAETAEGVSCDLLIDLQGPELRVGAIPAPLTLREGDTLTLGEAFPVPPILTGNLQDGDELLLDDGTLSLRVLDARAMTCRVERGGVLRSRKSLAVAGRELPASALTEMDMENLSRAREYGVTALMQPFVRGADDLRAVRAALRETGAQELKIFAKIENMTGLHRLDEILPLADVVVIARGDLGNAMPLWELPRAQTLIASKCRAAKRPFMVSTQMLHSMHHAAVPTRAEATDVYQAARSGADYLLLTGETAVGEYPVEAMTYFAKIAANGWADAE